MPLYKDVVSVAPRFARAMNIERDISSPAAIDGYIVTRTAEMVVSRVCHSFRGPAGQRAWTITGAYGSGKSAFAVFLANLLGDPESSGTKSARSILYQHSPALSSDLFDRRKSHAVAQGFCPVVLTAGSESLTWTLLKSVTRDVRRYCSKGRPPAALKKMEELLARAERGSVPSSTQVIEIITELSETFLRSGKSRGLLIIVDELGKFLEFAAREPERADIFCLQLLAEATGRFKSPSLLVFTILHQAFERYVVGLRQSVRDEWSKIQGRFEDVAFQETPDEFLLLISHAIEQKSALPGSVRKKAEALAVRAFQLGLGFKGIPKPDFLALLKRCAPLHPITVLVLARLCRKFGQNQRSLFSFLVSREPSGFLSFLDQPISATDPDFYGLAQLYEYASQALGSGLSVGESASRWTEVQSTLDRCEGMAMIETDLIKVVGLLGAAGAYGNIKASPQVLEFAVAAPRGILATAKRLQQRSILVFRKHSDSYALWQGSDIDLDARVAEAAKRLPKDTSLAQKLAHVLSPSAIVAKRHSIDTGTLRCFVPRFVDSSTLLESLQIGRDADGILLFAIPSTQAEFESMIELIASSPILRDTPQALVAVPRDASALSESLRELELLRWVEKNTPALEGDAVARRELRSRISAVEDRLNSDLANFFSPLNSTTSKTLWFHRGLPQEVTSGRSLSQLLSSIFDQVYSSTPRIHNELINRAALSSAAAKARRNLAEAMITKSTEPQLGIEGHPPELSMYLSLLQKTGIHRREEIGYTFGAPKSDAGLMEAWNEIESFFASCELQRRPVAELFSRLQSPPYGMKSGVVPVLFCAAILAHDTAIALYESGAFVPDITVELFERFLRSPEKFELRRYCIAGVRREVFSRFATLIENPESQGRKETFVEVVRPLFRFFNRLPAYSKQTKAISPTAIAVREALFAAREPDALLFEQLPRACGFEAILPNGSMGDDATERFFHTLKRALIELQRAYDELRSSLQQVLFRAFGVSGSSGREVIRFRSAIAIDHALEPRLRAFLLHLADEELDGSAWIEAIASLLVGKPARSWADGDRARYEVALSELARNFRHIEALVNGMRRSVKHTDSVSEVLRIGVTDRYAKDLEAVVVVERHNEEPLAEAVIKIEQLLEQLQAGSIANLALASLALVSRKYLSEMDSVGNTEKARKGVANG